MFNRKYIFKWWIVHCHVSFGGGKRLPFGGRKGWITWWVSLFLLQCWNLRTPRIHDFIQRSSKELERAIWPKLLGNSSWSMWVWYNTNNFERIHVRWECCETNLWVEKRKKGPPYILTCFWLAVCISIKKSCINPTTNTLNDDSNVDTQGPNYFAHATQYMIAMIPNSSIWHIQQPPEDLLNLYIWNPIQTYTLSGAGCV